MGTHLWLRLPLLGDDVHGLHRRLVHVGRLPVQHLHRHDPRRPDVDLKELNGNPETSNSLW